MNTYVPDKLHSAAETYAERNDMYGDTYKIQGGVMESLFPSGLHLHNPDDFNRYSCLVMIVSKLCRYAHNFKLGGHEDSLHDISVYATMLMELDDEALACSDAERRILNNCIGEHTE